MEISEQLVSSSNPITQGLQFHLDRNMTHLFLSPWFKGAEKNEVYVRLNDVKERSIYSLEKEFISVNLLWANYLIDNALPELIDKARSIIEEQYKPDGCNIGMICESAAGQTVMYFHCHVILRYTGDMADPRGGIWHAIAGEGYC